MKRAWVVALCACRIGFDARTDAPAQPADAADAPAPDAPADAAITTITFGERPTSQRTNVTTDAYISQGVTNQNHGSDEDLSLAEFAGTAEHSLLRFDLSSIPPGTPVVAARLALAKINLGDETAGPVVVRLLGESWTEGNGMPGSGVTWQTRDGIAAWMTGGGTTTQALASIPSPPNSFTVTLAPAIVQMWIDAPGSNNGVLITVGVNNAHYHLHARDSLMNNGMSRPELAIDVR